MPMARMNDRMAASARDQEPVDREGRCASHHQRESQTSPEQQGANPASIAPGMMSMIRLSTISMMVIEAVSDASQFGKVSARG
jgi:hypothetical protein